MSQFEYTNINKFFVSIGLFLIGLTFFIPWLFLRENFDLLIKAEDLKTFTKTAQHIIYQRQAILSWSPIIISVISILCFLTGILLCFIGIRAWYNDERLKQETGQLKNVQTSQEAKKYTPPEKTSDGTKRTLDEIKDEILSSVDIPINNLWVLNHWGSNVASIERVGNGKMIFKGRTRLDTDGSHIDLKDFLEVGSFYRVTCFVKASLNTTGKFQLWCHDNIGIEPYGTNAAIPYAPASVEGDTCYLKFEPKHNKHLRIHLQYAPGEGQIEVSNVKIEKLQSP